MSELRTMKFFEAVPTSKEGFYNPGAFVDGYLKSEADKYIQELKDAQRWRKCSEELPEEYVEVLFTDGNGYFAIGEMWILPGYDGKPDEQYWSGRGEPRCEDVKYWMPLPTAPKEDK